MISHPRTTPRPEWGEDGKNTVKLNLRSRTNVPKVLDRKFRNTTGVRRVDPKNDLSVKYEENVTTRNGNVN